MPVPLAPIGDAFQPSTEPFVNRLHMHGELSLTTVGAYMREAEEVEGVGLFLTLLLCLPFRKTPERNQPRLLRVQGQAEFGEPLRQDLQHLFRILPVLKTQDGVIGVSDLVRFPLQPGLHRFLEPFVQDLVQVDIGQKRADWLALAGSCLAHDQLAAVDGPP